MDGNRCPVCQRTFDRVAAVDLLTPQLHAKLASDIPLQTHDYPPPDAS
jgi:hypothetical protein